MQRMNPDNMLTRLVGVFLLLALCIGLAGYLYYASQKEHLKKNIQDEISAIADLKVSQIDSWSRERLEDGTSIFKARFFVLLIQQYLSDPRGSRLEPDLLAWMQTLREMSGYKSVLLVDPAGTVHLSTEIAENTTGPHAKELVRKALLTNTAILSDIHTVGTVSYPHLDLIAPIIIHRGKTTIPIGALVVRIDPRKFLFPLIEAWPTPSKTAESLLIRIEQGEAVFLNDLRHRKAAAGPFRISLGKRPELAAVLDRGEKKVIEISDYREVPVLAAIRPVPGTAWFLISKVDQEEIYAPIRNQAAFLSIIVLALIAAAGMSIIFWWRQKSADLMRKQYEIELKRKTLSQQYEYLSKYANDIILLVDPDGAIVEANDRAVAAYGYTRDELLGLTIRDLRTADKRSEIASQMKQVQEKNGFVFETRHLRKDGTSFPVEVSSRVIETDGKRFFQSIIRDVSERKDSEHALLQSEKFLQTIIDTEPDCIKLLARDGTLLMMNRAGLAMIEAESFDRVRGRPVAPLVVPEYRDAFMNVIAEAFQGRPGLLEFEIVGIKGRRLWLETRAVPLRNDRNEITAMLGVTRDITGQKRAKTALVNEKNKLDAIITAIGDGISIQDKSYQILYQNQVHKNMIGEHVGRTCYEAYENSNTPCEECPVAQCFVDGEVHRSERSVSINGSTRFFEITSSPLKDEDGMIVAGIEAVRDITERKKAEQALIDRDNRFKRLIESVTDYIYTVKVEKGRGVATVHGPGCVTVTGYSPEEYHADPDLWYRMIFEEDRDAILKKTKDILSGSPVAPFEHRIIHKNGTIRWVKNTPVPRFDTEGHLVDYDGLITDITPLKHLEAQLRQAQKMEAIGQLAGGVAHDFNNILTAIIGYGNLILMKLPAGDAVRPFVSQILASAERAAQLTHSLLAFSRKQVVDLKNVNINAIIQRVNSLLLKLIGEDIEFKAVLCNRDLTVLADSVQMEQVLMNLVVNARDAIRDHGRIAIETSIFEIGEEFIRTHAYGEPGGYALMTISDTGEGMNEATRRRIFEPFFTTKEVGKGTGLGLSMVYGIIKQHKGYITVASEPGKGTTFSIYLPLAAEAAPEAEKKASTSASRGGETVLLAEDDPDVRSLTKMVLGNFGYRVIEAMDGEDAVTKFNEQNAAIDLLVLDVIMPKKSGKDAYLAIRQIRPDIKVLFTSGYTADLIHKKGILDPDMVFIMKPISPTMLLGKVREVLDK
jgi:PAS domain S-box-containing protein